MNKFMNSLSFPDVNVWLALILDHHVHRTAALQWWNRPDTGQVGLLRLTQTSVLRLLTTAAAMDSKPLTLSEAWQTYDRLYEDDRVALFPEPTGLERDFRRLSSAKTASPKVWADAYLVAFASCHQGQLVTFDRALENRGADCLVLR
ncbi:MAG: PIN domain-containing protein [Acidobacteriaceae bacterium]|nr:PIN domain-containing protein [Acidobacteriaceae bacterium]MBV9225366.1 PIN domain-containing protein [Acidobacteriaceae bacterium]